MKRHGFDYQPHYCEENILRLAMRRMGGRAAGSPQEDGGYDGDTTARGGRCRAMEQEKAVRSDNSDYVVLVSSRSRRTSVYLQRLTLEGIPILWDYHVVLYDAERQLVFDFDSRLPFPCDAAEYMARTFRRTPHLSAEMVPLLRGVATPAFVADFYSDRSHMRDAAGRYVQPPPPWPPPTTGTVALSEYLAFDAVIRGASGWTVAFEETVLPTITARRAP